MTYQELYHKLHLSLSNKAMIYKEMDKKISRSSGFGDPQEIFNYRKAKHEWQLASNNYHHFLAFFKEKGSDPGDTIAA